MASEKPEGEAPGASTEEGRAAGAGYDDAQVAAGGAPEREAAAPVATESEASGEGAGAGPAGGSRTEDDAGPGGGERASADAGHGGASAPPAGGGLRKAAWGAPFAKLDGAWRTLESRLCAGVLIVEALTLVFWISIRAMSQPGEGFSPGTVFRSLLTALVFGGVAHLASKRHARRELIVTAAVLTGLVAGTRWGETGATYFSNVFAWLQNSSILVFFGGVSELAKRLTLWLALLGASLATAQGKHINVDVVMRFLSPRGRVAAAVIGWVAAAIVSLTASWGFFDYVAVEEMRAPASVTCADDPTKRCPAPPGSKIEKVLDSGRRNVFLASRQLSLDLRSLPKIIAGTPYNKWMTPEEWNAWLRGGRWERHFDAADVKMFELPEDGSIEFRNPSVTAIPGGTEPIPKLLVPMLNLVFAFGLFVIGLRFLLRALLALAGWVEVDPGAAHGDEGGGEGHGSTPAVAGAAMKGTHS